MRGFNLYITFSIKTAIAKHVCLRRIQLPLVIRGSYVAENCRVYRKRVKLEAHWRNTKHDGEEERNFLIISKWLYESGKFPQTAATCSRWFLAFGFFYPEDGGDTFPPKRRFTQNLHGATSQKTAFFIVTPVKTWNPTWSLNKLNIFIKLQPLTQLLIRCMSSWGLLCYNFVKQCAVFISMLKCH
jgi:hypothetical protein